MSYQKNFGNYRDALKMASPPCIPFLGLYLTDLTFIEDGNKNHLGNGEFINFDKRLHFKSRGFFLKKKKKKKKKIQNGKDYSGDSKVPAIPL